jgi:hypothetical protein
MLIWVVGTRFHERDSVSEDRPLQIERGDNMSKGQNSRKNSKKKPLKTPKEKKQAKKDKKNKKTVEEVLK